jgi:hypothetical protein
MADYSIHLGFEGPGFVAVPNAVADDPRLSSDALAALVYLARLAGGRAGAVVRVSAVRARFGWGRDRWQSAARCLRAAGALADHFGRSSDGRAVARALVVRWPSRAPEASAPEAATCEPGNPVHTVEAGGKPATCEPGNPVHLSRVIRSPKREQIKQGARACAEGLASPRIAARPSPPASSRVAPGRAGEARAGAAAPPLPGRGSGSAGDRAERGAQAARPAPGAAAAALVARLSPFERSQVRKGGDVLLAGVGLIRGASAEGRALARALHAVERGL